MNIINDMISIIIPVYNSRDVVEECICSVLAQSCQNFEIIIIDDGSSDDTFDVCKRLAAEEPRIRLLSTEHVGVSSARNKGLDAATGEYIFFLDSDDVIYPLLLETLASGMKNSGADIAGTDVVNVSEAYWSKVREKLKEEPIHGETVFQTNEEALAAMFYGSSALSCIGGVMMRRDLIRDTRFRPDLFIGEDFYFIYENLIKGATGAFLKQKWYYCRIHANNSSWNYSFSAFWSRFYRRELVWKSEESFGRTEYAKLQKRCAYNCFIRCIRNNKPYSKDGKKMRRVLREYKKTLLPAITFKEKIIYLLYAYFPALAVLLFKLKKRGTA